MQAGGDTGEAGTSGHPPAARADYQPLAEFKCHLDRYQPIMPN